jgi:RsiW-degrading membrane proteinase PrsW (M82 family)
LIVTLAIISILILIGVVYRRDLSVRRFPGRPFWYPYRRILGMLLLALIPIVLVNRLFPPYYDETVQDKLERGNKLHSDRLILEAYNELSGLYPDSLEIRFEQVDYQVRRKEFDYGSFLREGRKMSAAQFRILHTYAEVVSDIPKVRLSRLDSVPDNLHYVNYVRALAYRTFVPRDNQRVEYYLLREVLRYPHTQRAWEFLWTFYLKDPLKLDKLMQNPEARPFIPGTFRKNYYFTHGQWDNYASYIVETRILNVSLITAFSAFLVSFVWLVFLRSMDIFNREKWWHILLVFFGGAAFTFLCLPIYDYASLMLNFGINGSLWNDLLYCIAVIGGGEELVKMVPWLLFGLFSRKLKEPFDYILYASATALGFSFTENLMYLEDSGNIVSRSIMSTVTHMFDASIIAYAFILARYKVKNILLKLLLPPLGFVLACTAHGFYDFWLISPVGERYYLITYVFFLVSIHIWFFFKNNAINNSDFFINATTFNSHYQQDLLTFSMVGLLMVEYVFTSAASGSWEGNAIILNRAQIIAIFLVYISFVLRKMELKKGEWKKWRFRIPNITGRYFRLPFTDDEAEKDHIGLKMRLFAPKSNPYIGEKLPKSGAIVQKIKVSGDADWYVFQLNTPLIYDSFVPSHVIIKNKDPNLPIDEPKIEIYFMLIPEIGLLQKGEIDIRQLRYAGRAYSMPV